MERKIEKIRGTNLGNWLVLEKWMQPHIFEETDTEDETWLNRKSDKKRLAVQMKAHRESYITEEDFKIIAGHGMNMVRIPVPYFVFGDVSPFNGCIDYLDLAFDWAEKNNLKILIDLHTTPDGQNGYDNGGICGVCKWCHQPDKVEFIHTVLERLAKRYATRDGLYGIEVLNEPISMIVWLTSPTRKKAADKSEAEGSTYVPMKFLKKFYQEAYVRLRKILPEEKAIVFHDGFRLLNWGKFFSRNNMKNVLLDTHIYIFAMEGFVPIHAPWVYKIYISFNKWKIQLVQKQIPVIVGEWCICNKYSEKMESNVMLIEAAEKRRLEEYQKVAKLELSAWEVAAGYFYWNYQLYRDQNVQMDQPWKESWDLRRCWDKGWMPTQLSVVTLEESVE